jgi:L-ascorbate metabolism protein UlaG (beta-lactamase superfamily)
MTTRRKFLAALGASMAMPGMLIAQEPNHKRSWWHYIFNDDKTAPAPLHPKPLTWSNATITAAWIGHSTILINFFGTHIITDPVFSERVGVNILGLVTVGPKRLVEPALKFDELPPIDLILVSHAHMDHCDLPTLKKFSLDTPVIMAKNTADVLDGLDFKKIYEIDWGEKIIIGDVEIEGLEVKHFGWRYPWEEDRSRGNRNSRSYNAYRVSKNGKTIVFGGDTAFQEFFKQLKERNIPVELAMMPIGTYNPWIRSHANPEQSLAMADQMGAKNFLPMHWGTFIQSDEPVHEPIERLKKAVTTQHVVLDTIGETWSLAGNAASSPRGSST